MAIQRFLISRILLPLSRLTLNWSDKKRDTVFICSGLLIFFQYFLYEARIAIYHYLIFFTIFCALFGLMILSTLRETIQPVRFRKFGIFCWLAIGCLMFLSGILVYPVRMAEAVLILVAYPVVFIVWNNFDSKRIFSLLCRICTLSLIPYTVVNILFYPFNNPEYYQGLMVNPNRAGRYLTLVMVCLLTKLIPTRKLDWEYFGDLVLLGLCAAQLDYSNSRTCYLALIITAFCTVFLYLLTNWKQKKLFLCRNILLGGLVALIFINSGVYLLQLSKFLPVKPFQPNTEQTLPSDPSKTPENPLDSPIYSLDSFKGYQNNKLFTDHGGTLDRYSSGRISIWRAYIGGLNMIGNPEDVRYPIEFLSRVPETAHNTMIQVAHESGIPAGIFYLLYNLFSGFAAIWYAVRHKSKPYALFPFVITMTFGVISVFEALVMSPRHMITFYYYLVQFPLIAKLTGSVNTPQELKKTSP